MYIFRKIIILITCQFIFFQTLRATPNDPDYAKETTTNKIDTSQNSNKKSDAALFEAPQKLELISFDAYVNEKQVNLSWVTSTEINNDFFTIERSRKGRIWKPVLTTSGAGNSNQLIEYFEADYKPLRGSFYYRLKQTNFDGNYSYSNRVYVKHNRTKSLDMKLYPNPIKPGESFNIQLNNVFGSEIIVVIRDISGKEFYSKIIINMECGQFIGIPTGIEIPKGVYLVTATSEDQIQGKKLIIK